MSDVRLTATNPDDSTVVPVACNERGELLVSKTVIDEIDNDVTIDGNLRVNQPEDFWNKSRSFLGVNDINEEAYGYLGHHGGGSSSFALVTGGYRVADSKWKSTSPEGSGDAIGIFMGAGSAQIVFGIEKNKETGSHRGITSRFSITEEGASSEVFRLGPLNGQRGPTIDVGEELVFLRAQVRLMMEKLKMTPEGGWPVWDGSEES